MRQFSKLTLSEVDVAVLISTTDSVRMFSSFCVCMTALPELKIDKHYYRYDNQ